jgi:hypothetical protein
MDVADLYVASTISNQPDPKLWPHVFPLSDLDLDFFARKFPIKLHKHCKMVHSAYA